MIVRRRNSLLVDLVELGGKLPWWVSMCLAIFTFIVFRHVAGMEIEPLSGTAGIGASVFKSGVKAVAGVFQYVVPAAFLFGVVVSVYRRLRGERLLRQARGRSGLRAVAGMDWRQFEQLIGAMFRKRGYEVEESAAGPDGGIDLQLVKDGEVFLVQCKHWRSQRVGVAVVRELYGVMAAQGAAGGYVVTAGSFTSEAERFASGRNLELVDGQLLDRWIAPLRDQSQKEVIKEQVAGCPRCGSAMVLRQAKRGSYAGKSFYGCSRFPSCRGTRQV